MHCFDVSKLPEHMLLKEREVLSKQGVNIQFRRRVFLNKGRARLVFINVENSSIYADDNFPSSRPILSYA
jgi:hypothetical protein